MTIIHATIHTMEDWDIEDGWIAFDNGVITGIGEMAHWNGAREIIDARHAHLFPGLIDAHCHLGMWEDGLDFEGDDGNEDTDPITPQLRAIDAINPMDKTFQEALAAGITTVVTGPGSSNPIAGQFAAVKTCGGRIDDMLLDPYVAMKMSLGENPKCTYFAKHQAPVTRMATTALIREALFKAKEYLELKEKYQQNPEENDPPEFDMKSESLLPVLQGRIPVKFHAHRADDIYTALRISKEFGLKATIEHGTEGWLIADVLKAEGVPVAVGPVLCSRSKPELKQLRYDNAAQLNQAGVPVCIITDHPEIPVNFLSTSVMTAVQYGLPERDAMKCITISAARHCGLEARVGSLKVGKDADFLLCTGHPVIQPFCKIQSVFINGKRVLDNGLLS